MRDFETEKQQLIKQLEAEKGKSKTKDKLTGLKEFLESLSGPQIDRQISRILIDRLDITKDLKDKLVEFEIYCRDKTNLIKSEKLRQLAKALKSQGVKINFYGRAWTNAKADWIYFDIVLDIEPLKEEFKFDNNIIVYENLDSKSGTERGFIDKETGEGLMGRLK